VLTGWILTILPWGAGQCQSLLHNDTVKLPLNSWFAESKKTPLRFTFTPRIEYSATAGLSLYLNSSDPSGSNSVTLNQTLRYLCYISKPGKINLSNSFFHRLGFRSFFDSITEISFDENTLNTRLEVRLYRWMTIAAESEISTRIFNRYLISLADSSHSTRYLDAGFLTPMTWNLSAGVTFPVKGYGSLLLGMTGAKLTFVRDRRVFENPMITSFYGVSPVEPRKNL